MGKASRTKQDSDRRARIAAQREAQRRAEQRKRIYLAGGSILVVAIVVIALVLVKLNSGGGTAAASSNGPDRHRPHHADQAGHRRAVQRHRQGRGRRGQQGPVRLDAERHRRQQRVVAAGVVLRHGQRHAADVRRQARGAVHGRRVLPVLRRPALVDGQRPQPVRHVHRPDHHALVEHRLRPEHADLDVLQVDVQERLHHVHLGRGDHQRAPGQLLEHVGPVRDAADPDVRPADHSPRPTTRAAPSRSSTWATSTSRSATSRRSTRRCSRARPGPRSPRP